MKKWKWLERRQVKAFRLYHSLLVLHIKIEMSNRNIIIIIIKKRRKIHSTFQRIPNFPTFKSLVWKMGFAFVSQQKDAMKSPYLRATIFTSTDKEDESYRRSPFQRESTQTKSHKEITNNLISLTKISI